VKTRSLLLLLAFTKTSCIYLCRSIPLPTPGKENSLPHQPFQKPSQALIPSPFFFPLQDHPGYEEPGEAEDCLDRRINTAARRRRVWYRDFSPHSLRPWGVRTSARDPWWVALGRSAKAQLKAMGIQQSLQNLVLEMFSLNPASSGTHPQILIDVFTPASLQCHQAWRRTPQRACPIPASVSPAIESGLMIFSRPAQ